MKKLLWFTFLSVFSFYAQSSSLPLERFTEIYKKQFSDIKECSSPFNNTAFALCSGNFKNEGSSPFIMHKNEKTDKVVVLFHGLSDSPFFLSKIAEHLHGMGINVIIPLLPAHGLHDANDIMQSSELSQKWQNHVAEVMALAPEFGEQIFIGGFSTGGALATLYTFNNPQQVKGLLLFSGALQLSGNVESLAKIWGIQMVARIMDGDYLTQGPNPYKYPSVSSSAALELVEIIEQIRDKKEAEVALSLPLFVVHSEADITTPIEGVEALMAYNKGANTALLINEQHQVCHADVVVNATMIKQMSVNKDEVNPLEPCALPKANKRFRQLTALLSTFFNTVN